MTGGPPGLFALDPDDYHARDAGRLPDGRQFFLTAPFVAATAQDRGREFLALYLFDADGILLEARIEDFGPRGDADVERQAHLAHDWLESLGPTTQARLLLRPFQVERFGVTFGFVPRAPEDPGEPWYVVALPGNFMAFTEPWDSGEYDT